MFLKSLLPLMVCAIVFAESAKILGVFQRPSRSHHILGSILFKALAERGHQVTMISPFRMKTPVKNYEELELIGLQEFNDEHDVIKKYIQTQNASFWERWSVEEKAWDMVNERFFNHAVVKDLLSSNRTFDLVILHWLGNEAFLGLSHHFGASTIAFSTIGSTFMSNPITANPAPYSYVSGMTPAFPDEMNFLQRAVNTVIGIMLDFLYHFSATNKQQRLCEKYFPGAPSTIELRSNVSMVFLNSHLSIESPRPYVPSMVQIGGLHIEEPKELKADLKQFMDSAVDGVIFFSLGSNVKVTDLPKEKLEAIIKTFARLPMKILWKCETDNVPNLSANVKVGKWFPQRDVLAHPNVKLFVTHGGLLSTIESVYHGVPMVGIPFFGDQETNVDDGVNKGYMFKVAFLDLSVETLTIAINEVLNNPKYRENVRRRSMVLKDQPLKPLDNAVFWVGYVLRHRGAHHLKTSALKLKWYQYYLLDVFALLIGIVALIAASLYLILRTIAKLIKTAFTATTGKNYLSNKKIKTT